MADAGSSPFALTTEANDAVASVLDEVLCNGAAILYDHYLSDRESSYAVSRVMGDLLHVMNWAFLPGDGEPGDEPVGTDTFFDDGSAARAPGTAVVDTGMWAAEEEPVPATVDTWARGAIPTRKKAPKAVEEAGGAGAGNGKAGSGSRAGKGSPSTRSRRGLSRPSGSTSQQSGAGSSSSASMPAPPNPMERTMSPRLTVHPPEPVVATKDQAVRARALAEMRRKEAEREERARKEAEEAQKEAEDADRLKKELRGKKFTLDEYGQVLMVKRVNQSRLPPAFQDVPVSLAPSAEDEVASQAPPSPTRRRRRGRNGGGRSGGSPGRGAAGGGGGGRGGGVNAPDSVRSASAEPDGDGMDMMGGDGGRDVHYQESITVQPPLADTISLAPGVVLRDGASVIEGPAPPEDSVHMSRRDFSFHQTTLSAAGPETSPRQSASLDFGSSVDSGAVFDPEDPHLSVTRDPEWGANPLPASSGDGDGGATELAPPSRKPTADQRFKALGTMTRNPRDRAPKSVPNTSSRRAAHVSGSGTSLPDEDDSLLLSNFRSQDSLTLPPIESSGGGGRGRLGASRRSGRRTAEWGENAARKNTPASISVTDRAKELLSATGSSIVSAK